jgi:phenylpropionate dioxygenase-like ring-hydroxylating dioxygenase large terminal subunit
LVVRSPNGADSSTLSIARTARWWSARATHEGRPMRIRPEMGFALVGFEESDRALPTSEEVEAALGRCWQPVARVEDLMRAPQRAVLLGHALAVFLTESGAPGVVADRCPHRGASLSMGKVCGESLRCPYHGWEWSGDGACTRIPSLADQCQIPADARVESFPVREQWGLIWTALEEPREEPPTLSWSDAGKWTWGHGKPFELPVSLGVMIENFRDVAHFAFVHRKTLGDVAEVVEELEVERDGLEVKMEREMTAIEGAEESWGSLPKMRYHVVAPNIASTQTFSAMGERCLIHAARAISATESAHYWIQGLRGDATEARLEEVIEFEERVYAEDRPIVSAIKPAELALDQCPEVSTLSDRFTVAYRQAFVEFVRRAEAPGAAHSSSMSS